jgi:DNA-binding NarL/FixJ family response regulator
VTGDDRLRVVVADDEALFRSGLSMIIEAEPDLTVVAEASDGQQAVDAVRAKHPDVVLMDIQMPGLNGIAATAAILRLNLPTRVLVLTTFGRDGFVYDALRSGASGYLLKTVPPAQLVQAVRSVAAGDALLAPTLTRRLIEDWIGRPRPNARDPRLARLTDRERQVLSLVGHGLSNSEIATELHLSESTVKTHLARLLAKSGSRDRVQAVVLAYETGLVTAGAATRQATS